MAPLVADHQVVVVHGNGPQVGLLALQAAAYPDVEAYPLDVLDAGTQGMIGYLIQQELRSVLPDDQTIATLLTMVEVDERDPAFGEPTKFVGPVYDKDAADALKREKGWTFRQDGPSWRRVVPSPDPQRIVEVPLIMSLLDRGAVVVCAGGGGIPTLRRSGSRTEVVGVEAVVDKDLTSELLAENVGADVFVMATDVDGVYLDWGRPGQRKLDRISPEQLSDQQFPAGSMGPKVQAAVRFVTRTGRRAAIGALSDLDAIVAGDAGTIVVARDGLPESADPSATGARPGAAAEVRSGGRP
jgi:carbamate kinase